MDLQLRVRWQQSTKAKKGKFDRTNIPEAPWSIVEGNNKKRARLNCIAHLSSLIPEEEIPHDPIALPDRVCDLNDVRRPLRASLHVPDRYGDG